MIKRSKPRSLGKASHRQRVSYQHQRLANLWRLRLGITVGVLTVFGLGVACQLAWRQEVLHVANASALTIPTPFPELTHPPEPSGRLTNRQLTLITASPDAWSAQSEPEAEPATNTPAAAPSRVWLIVMPAVPIVGGFLICLSRRLLGKAHGENRLITHTPVPDAPSLEDSDSSTDA